MKWNSSIWNVKNGILSAIFPFATVRPFFVKIINDSRMGLTPCGDCGYSIGWSSCSTSSEIWNDHNQLWTYIIDRA
ncbi:MAG: hypothetical protein LUQ20_00685 [Candidatus Methanoperedens sp.]|nr:hypothetical protein [Candidatus Methanoperedens sp.]